MERHKALYALCKICNKIGIEVRSGQLTFELAMVDLDPILFMLVYWFIFMVIFGQKKEYFHIFVFVGLSMWNLFNKTVSGSVRIVAANRAVVTKVYIPKYFLIIILLFQNLFKMMISFGIVIVMMLWSHVRIM